METPAGATLLQYFADQAKRIESRAFEGIASLSDWTKEREVLRKQYLQSLGVDRAPLSRELKLTDHGDVAGSGFRARNVSYEILPDCYGSAMIFYPDPLPAAKNPAVLYLCGHSNFGILEYHPHAIMWARKGYICLILDTIRQTDNTGDHSGLSRHGRMDWVSMGYSAAGGEYLNNLRGLDVLCSLPEVDTDRVGATGLSGGGAHCFFLAVADERVRAVASACGVVNLAYTVGNRNYNSNCDCMFLYNPYRRDTSEFGALIAPRPLLLCHAYGDYLFTPDENEALYRRMRTIYSLYGREDDIRLFQFEGPHSYQPESVTEISRWFDLHLGSHGKAPRAVELGGPELSERQCTIFNGDFPVPDRLDILPEILTPPRSFPIPDTMAGLEELRSRVVPELEDRVFGYVAERGETLSMSRIHEWRLGREPDCARTEKYRASLGGMEIRITRHIPAGGAHTVLLYVCEPSESDVDAATRFHVDLSGVELIIVEPRAGGQNAYNPKLEAKMHLVGLYVGLSPVLLWIKDLREIIGHFRANGAFTGKRILLYGWREAGIAALYATLLDPGVDGVVIGDIFASHKDGGYIPGIMKIVDIEQALGLLAPRIIGLDTQKWEFIFWAARLYERLGIRDRIVHTHSMDHTLHRVLRGAENADA